MSDKQAAKAFKEEMDKFEELEKEKSTLQEKKIVLEKHRVNLELERIKTAQAEMEIAKNIDFGTMPEEKINQIRKENTDYFKAAKMSMRFINKSFDKIVPYFPKNLILVGAKTGEGKSTCVANIVFSTITQKNPATGKMRRALVLTNEEKSEDVYNRITCLINGWFYVNHDEFEDYQIKKMDENISILSKACTVIDNNYGMPGMTTTIEGIRTIFDNLIRDKVYYDVVIIDYYQNIKSSKEDSRMGEWEVQAKLANMLDHYKNEYPAPIILMMQVNPPDKNETPFSQRIKGRKIITDPATLIMEMVADRENHKTIWTVHKSRFTQSIGSSFETGFDRGRYVEYTDEFKMKVLKIKEERHWNKMAGNKMTQEIERAKEKGAEEK